MSHRIFYTDGSTLNNGSPDAIGGYAWVEIDQSGKILSSNASGIDPTGLPATNQRMELIAAIAALHRCEPEDTVTIYSDSAYLVNGMTAKWYKAWALTGKTSSGKTPKNLDLWSMLVRASERVVGVCWIHVKGHNKNQYNELCDKLAGQVTRALGLVGTTT